MAINIFEGSRRIAWLVTAVAIVGTVVALWSDEPYLSADYSISSPTASFQKSDGSCTPDSDRHFFEVRTSRDHTISINLCLVAMPFGNESRMLVPYKVDSDGRIWGRPYYSTEVNAYAEQLEKRFKLSRHEEEELEERRAEQRWQNLKEGFKYLSIGILFFWGAVWVTGWIVRGFLGIPIGKDHKQ